MILFFIKKNYFRGWRRQLRGILPSLSKRPGAAPALPQVLLNLRKGWGSCSQQISWFLSLIIIGNDEFCLNKMKYSLNVQEWKSTLLGVIIRDHFVWSGNPHSKQWNPLSKEWFKSLVWSGFHYFESGFPLQNEVILNMTPKRVDFHFSALRKYKPINQLYQTLL